MRGTAQSADVAVRYCVRRVAVLGSSRFLVGAFPPGFDGECAVRTFDWDEAKALAARGVYQCDAAALLGVSESSMSRIAKIMGFTWAIKAHKLRANPGRYPDARRRAYVRKFRLTLGQSKRLSYPFMRQLDDCKDDDARRILLKG
jgi:hypothetical protein